MAKKKISDDDRKKSEETLPKPPKDQRSGGGILRWKGVEETDPSCVRRTKETFRRLFDK